MIFSQNFIKFPPIDTVNMRVLVDTSMNEHEFQECLAQIRSSGDEASKFIQKLSEHARTEGLSQIQLSYTVELVLKSSLGSSLRKLILEEVLTLQPHELLLPDLFLRLLAALGPPDVYYRNGKQSKLRRLAPGCQLSILHWLIETLPLYGQGIYAIIRRAYPILFKLLTHDYCRQYITSLIVYGACDNELSTRGVFKAWQLEWVNEIASNHSSDLSLRVLRWYIRKCSHAQSTLVWEDTETPSRNDFENGMIHFTGKCINEIPSTIKLPNGAYSAIHAVKETLKSASAALLSPLNNRKKRKLSAKIPSSTEQLKPMSSESLPLSDLVTTLENAPDLQEITVSDLLAPQSKEHSMHLCLLLINPKQTISHKLAQVIQQYLLRDSAQSSTASLVDFLKYGGLVNEELVLLLSRTVEAETSSESTFFVRKQIDLIPYMPMPNCSQNIEKIVTGSQKHSPHELAALLFRNLTILYGKAAHTLKNKDLQMTKRIESAIVSSLPCIFGFSNDNWVAFDLESRLNFTRFLRTLMNLNLQKDGTWQEAYSLVPPRSLVYQLLVSTNPLIVSEVLGFISYLKTLKFDDPQDASKKAINCFVFDAVNFVWKDRAFKYDDSFSKGMFLDIHFLQRMGSLNFFGVSEYLMLKNIGGLACNPAFSLMFAEIVWSIEDAQPDITVRHPGPLSEESVYRLQCDSTAKWVPMSYSDIKKTVLLSLVRSGFTGIGQFLYSSVKSLQNEKQQ